MFRYWLTHRAPASAGLAAVLMAVLMLGFVVPHIGAAAENRCKTGVYADSDIDYDIPQPSETQLAEIAVLPFVDEVFGYYYTESTVTVRGKPVPAHILFSAHLDALAHTMYSPARLIAADHGTADNPVYIDEEFARQTNLKLGDELLLRGIVFQVARIYETNTYYTSAIFMPLTGAQKELVESTADSFSGAFLMVNDPAAAEAWLTGYKPMGRLKDRALFDTEAAYQLHYTQWAQSSYANEITSFAARLRAVPVRTARPVVLGAVLVGLVLLCGSGMLFFAQEKAYFTARKVKRGRLWFYGWTALMETGIMALSTVLGLWYAVAHAGSYCPPVVVTDTLVVLVVMMLSTAGTELLLCALLLRTVREDTDIVCADDGGTGA